MVTKASLVSLLLILLSACSSSQPQSSVEVRTPEPTTWSEVKASQTAAEDAQNMKAYDTFRGQGMSAKDSADAVDAVRDLCPHSDAEGKCI